MYVWVCIIYMKVVYTNCRWVSFFSDKPNKYIEIYSSQNVRGLVKTKYKAELVTHA